MNDIKYLIAISLAMIASVVNIQQSKYIDILANSLTDVEEQLIDVENRYCYHRSLMTGNRVEDCSNG